ncbi:PREDICTED: extensin-2-like [Bactrocera latifrons]|uniref:extensin-2-like n=1 Tax=Bactrocera latifrons TaxID=174628 RepID=UPI0008DD399F|nr:PREDICTED: extensin-2-like [Bactrocera latifrons]
MRRLWQFVIYATILSLCEVCNGTTAKPYTEDETTTIIPVTTTTNANTFETTTLTTATNLSEPLPILAAKLVRQRRQHPYTVIRHVVRSSKRGTKSRRRQKWPKYKYGPPNYSIDHPITYYKPTKQYLPEIAEPPKYSSIDELDLTNHFNFADYDGHAQKGNHYEDQTMDLDFYSNTDHSFPEEPKVTHIEYSTYDAKKEVPTYSYTSTKTEIRKPYLKVQSYKGPKHHGGGYEMSSSSSGDSGYEDTHSFIPPDNVYDMHPLSSYDTPSPQHDGNYYDYTPVDTSSHSNTHIPAAKYGVPDTNIPVLFTPPAKQPDYHAPKPTAADSYSIYDKKIPNAGYNSVKTSGHTSFAEPPPKTNVEITYSPSYEITLPPSNHKPTAVEDYRPVPGHFAEPPAEPTPSYHPPKTSGYRPTTTYRIPETPAPPAYSPTPPPPPPPSYHPPETHDPPESHAPPSYDIPESHEIASYEETDLHEPPSYQSPDIHAPTSYEVPELPQDPPSYQPPEPPIHPPSSGFEVPAPHPPPAYSAPEPPQPPSTYDPPDPNLPSPSVPSQYPQPDYISPSNNLPINSKYMPPAYDYPRSSYEVPIYDPIPFEASNNDEHETYPPHTFENQHIDNHAQSASSPIPTADAPATRHPANKLNTPSPTTITKAFKVKTKRKRLRNSTPAVTTKHILDAPELEEAFEAGQRHKNQLALSPDTVVNESNYVEAQRHDEPNYFLPTITPDVGNDNSYVSTAWNPIRIRAASTPTALPAVTATKAQTASVSVPAPTAARPKERRQNSGRQRQQQQQQSVAPSYTSTNGVSTRTRQTTKPLHSASENIAQVTVDKSRSYSYYGGTSTIPKVNDPSTYRTRPNTYRQPTRAPTVTRQNVPTSNRDRDRDEPVPHRTTKSVFETTYFKSPRNEHLERHLGAFAQSLPKKP